MPFTTESYIKRLEHTADTYEKKANRLWAQAKNGGADAGYKYSQARDCYERVKKCRASAEAVANGCK